MRYNKKTYKLLNLDNGFELTLDSTGINSEPLNYDESDFTIKRSTKNLSFSKDYSLNIEFVGAGADFLRNAYSSRYIEAKVQLYEYRVNPNTDVEYLFTSGDLDFSDFSDDGNIVKIPFNSGGLSALLEANKSNKYELGRELSISGKSIDSLKTKEFAVIDRPLPLNSLLETSEEYKNNIEPIAVESVFSNVETLSVGVPLSIVYSSDENITSIIPNQIDPIPSSGTNKGLNAAMFYYNNDIDRFLDLKISCSFDYNTNYFLPPIDKFSLDFIVFENDGSELIEKERISLAEDLNFPSRSYSNSIDVTYNVSQYELKEGESLSLQFYVKPSISESPVQDFIFTKLYISNLNTSIEVNEQSYRSDLPRRSKCVLNKDAGENLMQIITGEPIRYVSEFFNSGDFNLSAITSGKLIRGFLDDKISTSFKDFTDNCKAIWNMSYNIEVVDGIEKVVHEPLEHFFREETAIIIPNQVANVTRKPATEFVHNLVKSGYKKPSGDNLYEEVNGLNEYNTTNEYSLPITRVISDYDIESPYRADSEGKELTLRQSIKINPTGDYRTDDNIFNLDLKNIGTSVLVERTWKDDYEEEPKNALNPSTLTGLRFTPFRNLKRHFLYIKSSLINFTDEYIRYSSTRGNSELVTKKVDEVEYSENGNYLINEIGRALFVAKWIEFEYPVNFDLMNQVNGFTNVNGRRIPNTYFKVEFINEFNKKEYGYLFQLKPNKNGKWKLLKAV